MTIRSKPNSTEYARNYDAIFRKAPKPGDKIMIDGEEATVVHVTPAIDETCQHDWEYDKTGPEYCKKCGLSFTRYIFCCCP
jgi:hypothetical protein